jgi:hypothetical protein
MTDWYGYPYIALSGGADGALDSLDGAALKDGDFAVVVVPGTRNSYIFTLDADSGATEDGLTVIAPDNNAGDKRWVLTNAASNDNDVTFFGATGNGVADDRTAIEAADAGATGFVHYPTGTYKVGSDITLTTPIVMDAGAMFLVATGATLTLNCPIQAGYSQIFSWAGTGKVVFASGGTPAVYPEWWGATRDGSTDDAAALQACFTAVQGSTYRPRINLLSGKYAYATGLTIAHAEGMTLRGGTGGFYTAQAAGYTDTVTMLYYTGSGAALTIGDGSQAATGFIAEKIYLKGTSSAGKGIYFNTVGGVRLNDITVGQFTKSGGAGVWILKSQLITFDHCAFIQNYFGTYQEGNATEITQMTYNKCVWHSNTNKGHYEECGVNTQIINPTFQDNEGQAIVIDAAVGFQSKKFCLLGGYFTGNCVAVADFEIDIRGDATSAATWHVGFVIRDVYFGSPGASHAGYMRFRNTNLGLVDNCRFDNATALMIVAAQADNNDLSFDHWNGGLDDSVIQNGAAATVPWPKQYIGTDLFRTFKGGSTKIWQALTSGDESLSIQQDDDDVAFIDFVGTSAASAAKSISSWTNGAALNGFVRVEINGTVKWIPYYTAPSS